MYLFAGILISLITLTLLYLLLLREKRAERIEKEMTMELRQSEQKYRTIFEALQDVYYQADMDGRISVVSPSIVYYTGLPAEQVIGRLDTDFYLNPKEHERMLAELYKTGAVHDYEVTFKGAEGKPLPVSISAKVICDTDGKICAIGGVLRDITKRKQQEEILERKNKELETAHEELAELVKKLKNDKKKLEEAMTKDEFLSMAAHELRTPLGIMRWRLEVLFAEQELPSTVKETLEKNYDNIIRLVHLVNNLLDVSRINQDKVKDNPEEIDLVTIIQDSLDVLDERIKGKHLAVVFHKPKEAILVIDQSLLEEVIFNLLSNAIKYNKQHGKLTVTVTTAPSHVAFSIADTGIGIPKEDQASIFDKFKRGSNAVSDYEGTGLGLFVVKSYVDRWHGKIHLKSEEGKGTTFTIELPKQNT